MAHIVTVTESESGQKLINFLRRRLADKVPNSALMRWIRTGQVRVDKGRAKPFVRIKAGSEVRLPPQAMLRDVEGGCRNIPEKKAPLLPDIIHNDDKILVLNKPAGLPVHGGTRVEDSLAACLAAQYGGYAFTPTLAHRLDKDTSGLIIAALGYEALSTLHGMFANHEVVKIYLAWVKGRWREKGVTLLQDRLEKKRGHQFERTTTGSGKHAETRAVAILSSPEKSLLALRLITGRTHQLRAQLSDRGHAILGDRKYGGPLSRRLRLHAWRILLPDSGLGEAKSFAALPDWQGEAALSLPLSEVWWGLLEDDPS